MSDQNERDELEALRGERAEVEALKAEFLRRLEALYDKTFRAAFRTEVEQLKAEFLRRLEALYEKYDAELTRLSSAEVAEPARPLQRRKPPDWH